MPVKQRRAQAAPSLAALLVRLLKSGCCRWYHLLHKQLHVLRVSANRQHSSASHCLITASQTHTILMLRM